MGHTVGDAADRATQKGTAKSKTERTEEQILKDIGNHLDAHLAIPPDDVRLLWRKYSELKSVSEQSQAELEPLPEPAQDAMSNEGGLNG